MAPEDTGEELEGPEGCEAAETDAGDDAGDVAGDAGAGQEAGYTEEGGGETMASNGHTSGASKAASATSRVRNLVNLCAAQQEISSHYTGGTRLWRKFDTNSLRLTSTPCKLAIYLSVAKCGS